MKQLTLTHDQLTDIGFTKITPSKVDEFNPEKVVYSIECLNGTFSCQPAQEVYRWYHSTTIRVAQVGVPLDHSIHPAEVSNHININITDAPSLFTILEAFRVKHNFFII
jgi:hypothetical protein